MLRALGLATLAWLAPVAPQSIPTGMPLCATPRGGLDSATACERLPSPLPVVVLFRPDVDAVPFLPADMEALLLEALARGLRIDVRGDSAWAFAHRSGSHVWVEAAPTGAGELRAVMVYWRGESDGTLTKLCEFDDTITAPRRSMPGLAVRVAATAEALGRCGRSRDTVLALSRSSVEDRPPPSVLPAVLLAVAITLVGSVGVWWLFIRRPPPDFWRLAARYPDKAYDWFQDHGEWIVADYGVEKQPRPDTAEFEGPFLFWVPKLGGRRVAVYGRRGKMRESQRAFLRTHGLDSEGMVRR